MTNIKTNKNHVRPPRVLLMVPRKRCRKPKSPLSQFGPDFGTNKWRNMRRSEFVSFIRRGQKRREADWSQTQNGLVKKNVPVSKMTCTQRSPMKTLVIKKKKHHDTHSPVCEDFEQRCSPRVVVAEEAVKMQLQRASF